MSLIEGLQKPTLYDHRIDKFEVIETHISWVLLTGEYVYKIKKPVNFGFLDFTTLEKRRFYCQEELRLNRRLASILYLDVVAISGTENHPEQIQSGDVINSDCAIDNVIEYAVKMRQFPQSSQLDRLLEKGGLDQSIMDTLAEKVATFHLSISVTDKDSIYGDLDHIQQPVLENFSQIKACHDIQAITSSGLDKLAGWTQQQLQNLSHTIKARKNTGYVRECHGDMHLRNIAYWQSEIIIFDCIEFNKNFYWIDVMSEIAFLVMDLEARQQNKLAQRFLNSYLERTGDYEGLSLFLFYKVYRAMVRAKVAALRLVQESYDSKEFSKTIKELKQYIELAEQYTTAITPVLLINFGLSGSGKSVGAGLLAEQLPAIRIRSDVERKRLFSGSQDNLYTAAATESTYIRLVELAQLLLSKGYSVIIDAANLMSSQRELFVDLAKSMKLRYFILAYQAEEKVLRQRVMARAQLGTDASDATVEILNHQIQNYQPLTNVELAYTIEIDTTMDIDLDRIIRIISAGGD